MYQINTTEMTSSLETAMLYGSCRVRPLSIAFLLLGEIKPNRLVSLHFQFSCANCIFFPAVNDDHKLKLRHPYCHLYYFLCFHTLSLPLSIFSISRQVCVIFSYIGVSIVLFIVSRFSAYEWRLIQLNGT